MPHEERESVKFQLSVWHQASAGREIHSVSARLYSRPPVHLSMRDVTQGVQAVAKVPSPHPSVAVSRKATSIMHTVLSSPRKICCAVLFPLQPDAVLSGA